MAGLTRSKVRKKLVKAIEDRLDAKAARAALKEKGGMSLAAVRKKLGL